MRSLLLIATIICLVFSSCSNNNTSATDAKVTAYVWMSGLNDKSDQELSDLLSDLKSKGIDGIMYQGGHDATGYDRVGEVARGLEMELHAWIPTMLQGKNDKIDSTWYAWNRNLESAYTDPAYVGYYTFLCPNRDAVKKYLSNLYENVASSQYVTGIHLDYIRFPDVILARGLWDKYGLVMNEEYATADYCYCDYCTQDFEQESGINIREVEDPSKVEEWKQFRYNLITNVVDTLAQVVHAKGKKINAAVFPGPSTAKKLVRQEWNKWALDAVYPMNYNDFYLKGTDWIGDIVHEESRAVNHAKPIYSGLFICPEPDKKATEKDPEGHGLLPEELGEAIRQSMINGASGVCLFTPSRMTDEHWAEFDKAIHKEYRVEGH